METGSAESFAAALKHARTRARISVEGLARRVGYSRSHISNIELGRRRCPAELVPHLDSVLQVNGGLILAWEAEEEMRRRGLLFVTPAALGLVSSPAISPGSEHNPLAQELHDRLLIRSTGKETREFGDIEAVERGAFRAHALYQQANYSVVAPILPGLIAAAERHAIRPGERVKPHRVLAIANLAASKVAGKLGDAELAWILADRAVASARQAGDVPLYAVASGQAAISLAKDTKRLSDAGALVQTAYDQLMMGGSVDARHISAQGNLLLINATIASRLKHRGVADRCLAVATELGEALGHDGNQLWTAFGPTNVELHRAAVSVAFEQPDRAIAAAERLDTSALPDTLVSRRAQLHLNLAAAYHLKRDGIPSAVLHLIEAERIAPQILRMNLSARRLVTELVRYEHKSATPGLRPLAQRNGVAV